MSEFKQTVFTVLCACVVFGSFAHAINTSMHLPDVHFSYATGDCVKVVNYNADDNYSCENLPERFYHVWEQ